MSRRDRGLRSLVSRRITTRVNVGVYIVDDLANAKSVISLLEGCSGFR